MLSQNLCQKQPYKVLNGIGGGHLQVVVRGRKQEARRLCKRKEQAKSQKS
jgi:hypothetical protein